MTADRTVTHLEGTDFQKSRAFSPAIVTQGGKIVWLAGQTALIDLDGKSIVHDFEAKPLALVKAGHPSAFDGADADQYVKSAVVGFDQAIAFGGVEPSDGSKRHIASSHI